MSLTWYTLHVIALTAVSAAVAVWAPLPAALLTTTVALALLVATAWQRRGRRGSELPPAVI